MRNWHRFFETRWCGVFVPKNDDWIVLLYYRFCLCSTYYSWIASRRKQEGVSDSARGIINDLFARIYIRNYIYAQQQQQQRTTSFLSFSPLFFVYIVALLFVYSTRNTHLTLWPLPRLYIAQKLLSTFCLLFCQFCCCLFECYIVNNVAVLNISRW